MAKKNSSKTITEKAMQSAEPRVMSYQNWTGVNFVDAPLTWEPLEPHTSGRYLHNQTDLPKNYLMVQNNLETTDTLSLETRYDSIDIGHLTSGGTTKFTGISFVFHKWIFAVVRVTNGNSWYEQIKYRDLTSNSTTSWSTVNIRYYGNVGDNPPYVDHPAKWRITEIGAHMDNLVVTATNENVAQQDEQDITNQGKKAAVFLARLHYDQIANTINITGKDFNSNTDVSNIAVSNPLVPNPTVAPVLSVVGMYSGQTAAEGDVVVDTGEVRYDHVVKIEVCYCYTTRFGSTKPSPARTIYTTYQPTLWSSARYVNVSCPTSTVIYKNKNGVEITKTYTGGGNGTSTSTTYSNKTIQFMEAQDTTGWTDAQKTNRSNALSEARKETVKIDENVTGYDTHVYDATGITGIDFYGRDTENVDWVFIGHLEIANPAATASPGTGWKYVWLGNMTDIGQWTNSQLTVPTENNTRGPSASHWASHDSRLYYWGDPYFPYRLYIGGSPGNEFSVARGLGGAWIDVEPGSGYQIMGTAKWKTNGGANIVTLMCGNANTTKVKRFNVVETNITVTNEIQYKGYMYEEVSNVVGCNSRYGYGVFADGLYSINRYGLYVTTMAMEYNNQMKNTNMSEVIKPLFSEQLGNRLKDSRLVCIDNVIYIAFSAEGETGESIVDLDNVILCYDIDNKAWYTFTCDVTLNRDYDNDPDKIHHILAIDSDEFQEGLGVITDYNILLYPTTGVQNPTPPAFDVLLETGEMMPKEPLQVLHYVQQIELRFDYFVSDPGAVEVLLEGVDYYGREFTITKELNKTSRGFHGKSGEMREYVEWIRVDKYVESLRMRIKGKGRFRLTHWNMKWYAQSDTYNTQWGFDAHDQYRTAHDTDETVYQIHHYINDYNNLRRAVIS